MPQNGTNQQLTQEWRFVSPGALHDVTASGCVGMSKRNSDAFLLPLLSVEEG